MRNPRILGILLMIFGALFVADGAVMEPVRWWRAGVGIIFIIIGIVYFLRARRAAPPT